MKVLVTGANGFIGSALCPALTVAGMTVREAVRATIGEIDASTDWTAALAGIDAVVHLAGRVHVMNDRDPDSEGSYRRLNVEATEALANACVRAGVQHLVYVSTAKVHGEGRDTPYTEDDEPAPQEAYARSKADAERALARIASSSPLSVTIVRPPLVYGPGVRANFLALLNAVDRRLPLPLGRVANRRSMVFVGNLADAIVQIVRGRGLGVETFLVSDGEDFSTPELLRRVGKALNRRPRIVPVPLPLLSFAARVVNRKGALHRLTSSFVVDSGRMRRRFGWTPPYTPDQGLAVTAEWYRRRNA